MGTGAAGAAGATDDDVPTGPKVRLRVEGSGRGLDQAGLAELFPGSLIGRHWTAALPVDHPSLSEAHALVSLRDGDFWLLALRRRFAVGGAVRSEVRLEPGLRVTLADEVHLVVEEVVLPPHVLALEAAGLPPVVLPSVCAVRGRPQPSLTGRFDPDAPCTIWTSGVGWRIRVDGGERALSVGDTFEVDGVAFRVLTVPLEASGPGVTRLAGGVDPPLLIVNSFDTVQIHRDHHEVLTLTGVQARLVGELASFAGPVRWHVAAGEIWPGDDEAVLRKRWDVALARTRARLREARVRPDLIHADGKGCYELVLRPEDRVEDRT